MTSLSLSTPPPRLLIRSRGRLVRTGYIEEMVQQNRTRQSLFKYISLQPLDFPLPVSTEARHPLITRTAPRHRAAACDVLNPVVGLLSSRLEGREARHPSRTAPHRSIRASTADRVRSPTFGSDCRPGTLPG